MAMRIDELLDIMDETLEEAFSLPFVGGKRMVDVDKVRSIIDNIRLHLPEEIHHAKEIVQDRADILAAAKREADAITKRAEERARQIVAQEAIVKAAAERAKEITTQAQNKCLETRGKMNEYCDDMLKRTENVLDKNLGEVKKLRTTLKTGVKPVPRKPFV